ncbi:MAG: hypothetical protein J6R32_10795 [Bacteroidales bacterium]|nr:hypothetical protein [Bacteroidales bacterium]
MNVKYIIEPYDADGIAQCKKCKRNLLAPDLRDIYIGDLNHFIGAYCKDCARTFNNSVSKPELIHTPMTYNDIIHYLSYSLEKSSDEGDELTALNNLETDINSLIALLQLESPSQTPSVP